MTNFKRLGLIAILSAAMVPHSAALASNEMTTRPWAAPVGHRQPRAIDIPTSASQQIIDQEDANVDRKIKGICRGC